MVVVLSPKFGVYIIYIYIYPSYNDSNHTTNWFLARNRGGGRKLYPDPFPYVSRKIIRNPSFLHFSHDLTIPLLLRLLLLLPIDRRSTHPVPLHLRAAPPQILQAFLGVGEILRRRSPIPSFRLLQAGRRADAHLGEVSHGEFGFGQAAAHGGFSRPEVGFGVGLREDAFGAGEVPAAEGEFGLVLGLHGRFAVPRDALPRVDGAVEQAVFVGKAEAVLGEFVAERGGVGETF